MHGAVDTNPIDDQAAQWVAREDRGALAPDEVV